MSSIKPFSFDTIDDFDDHISKSIPNYHLLSDSVRDLSTFFAKKDFSIVDLGCSTGKLLESIPFDGDKVGIDASDNLLPISHDNVDYIFSDIRKFPNFGKTPSLILSIFTLQFISLADRPKILKTVYDSLSEGGAFIWAEKVHNEDGELERISNSAYYDFKRKHFSADEIMQKEIDIRSIMQTNTSEKNCLMAKQAGFSKGTIFWKFYNFEAWMYIK